MDISVTHDNFSAKDFNPLPRKEGDKLSKSAGRKCIYFNPLPRKEGDRISGEYGIILSISIHSLVKRETSFHILHFPQCTDFNPLPRKEGDGFASAESSRVSPISIHSLVKRETLVCFKHNAELAISIHSLVKRETALSPYHRWQVLQFQSTPS